MGDFWGLNFTGEEEKYGVSVAMVNSPKGELLLKNASENLIIETRTIQEATSGNPRILNCVKLNSRRTEFFERLSKEPFSQVVWSIEGSNKAKRIYASVKSSAKKFIKNIIGK